MIEKEKASSSAGEAAPRRRSRSARSPRASDGLSRAQAKLLDITLSGKLGDVSDMTTKDISDKVSALCKNERKHSDTVRKLIASLDPDFEIPRSPEQRGVAAVKLVANS